MTQPFTFRWVGQYNDEQSEMTFQSTDWAALLEVSKRRSGDPSSVYQGDYHAGGRHIVRRIQLPGTGQLWLARIPIIAESPDSRSGDGWWTGERRFAMESEIATMKYVVQATEIPVPTVFGYETGMNGNPVKLPYLLMQCIEGNMLFDLGGPDVLGDEQRAKIRASLASIQCQLVRASLSKLGCLLLTSDGDINVGPLPAAFGFKGPFDSMQGYFSAWADHNTTHKNLKRLEEPDLRRAAESFPQRLKASIQRYRPARRSNRFPIIHPDFLMHNILLNDEYEIVGVIDWEYAHSAPMAVFAARTNMYTYFDAEDAALHWDEEETRYMVDVIDREKEMNLSPQLSQTFGSVLSDLGLCMQIFEDGHAVPFDRGLKRLEDQQVD